MSQLNLKKVLTKTLQSVKTLSDSLTMQQTINNSTTKMFKLGPLYLMSYHVGVGQYNYTYTYNLSDYFPNQIIFVAANNSQVGFAAADAVSVSWSGKTVSLYQYNVAGSNMDMWLLIIGY